MGKILERITLPLIMASVILPWLTSCDKYPGIDKENTTQLVCWTYFDTLTDFTQFRTFTICDSLGVITSTGNATKVKDSRSEMIREHIIGCMQEAGYSYDPSSYDIFISMNEVEQTNVSVNYDPYMYFWNTYDPWGWGYFYGYPYYPQYYISSAYSSQTFSIQMGDKVHESVTQNGKKAMKVIWSSSIKGITGFNGSSDNKPSDDEIRHAISECFNQTDTAPFNSK